MKMKIMMYLCLFAASLATSFTIAGETYTKISDGGVELDDAASEWRCARHNLSGLIWEVKSGANSNGEYTYYTFFSATDYAAKMNEEGVCGYTDWRVPTIKELSSINRTWKQYPANDTTYFPFAQSSDYWSSSIYGNGSGGWDINAKYGNAGYSGKYSDKYVRVVRGEQYFDFFDYTKLDGSGAPLGENATTHACVQDNHGGLTWEVKDASTKVEKFTYEEASEYAALANENALCGYSDWRVPKFHELLTLVDYSSFDPAIKTNYFTNATGGAYWTASRYGTNYDEAWTITFFYGKTWYSRKTSTNFVRLVRGEQLSASLPFGDVDRLFNWIEQNFGQYFAPAGERSFNHDGFTIRHYEDTKTFLGEKDGDVFLYGDAFGGLLPVGALTDLLTLIE